MSTTPAPLPDVAQNWHRLSLFRHEPLLVCGALLALSLLVMAWIALTSKRRQRHSRHHSSSHHFGVNPGATAGDPALAMPHRRKWRRRRRDHRQRNPTLAETGGLPPVRHDSPGPSAP